MGHGVEVPQDPAVDTPMHVGTGGDCKNILLGVFFLSHDKTHLIQGSGTKRERQHPNNQPLIGALF